MKGGGGEAMENGQRRALLTILGVAEDGGSFVLLMGLVLVGLAALACFYCKVYDPVKVCCIKLYHRYKRGPRDEQAPPPERSPPPEVCAEILPCSTSTPLGANVSTAYELCIIHLLPREA